VSGPKGANGGADDDAGSGEYRRLRGPREVKRTATGAAGRRAYASSDAAAYSSTNKGVTHTMLVSHEPDEADILLLEGSLAGVVLEVIAASVALRNLPALLWLLIQRLGSFGRAATCSNSPRMTCRLGPQTGKVFPA
jgi:hypothetical protein